MPIVIGLGMLLAGAMSAAGSMNAAEAQAKAAQGNAANADQNANQLEWNATLVRTQTQDDLMKLRVTARQQLGTLRNNVAASGLTMGGNALDIMAESAANVEHDASAIRMAGNSKANSLMLQAAQQRTYGNLLREGAQSTLTGGALSAAGDVIGGVTKAASIQAPSSAPSRTALISGASDYTGRSSTGAYYA